MKRFGWHKIYKWGSYKKRFGFYFFKPCPCGCTTNYGLGLQLIWFGVKVYFTEDTSYRDKLKNDIRGPRGIRSGCGWTLGSYEDALTALNKQWEDTAERVARLEEIILKEN